MVRKLHRSVRRVSDTVRPFKHHYTSLQVHSLDMAILSALRSSCSLHLLAFPAPAPPPLMRHFYFFDHYGAIVHSSINWMPKERNARRRRRQQDREQGQSAAHWPGSHQRSDSGHPRRQPAVPAPARAPAPAESSSKFMTHTSPAITRLVAGRTMPTEKSD